MLELFYPSSVAVVGASAEKGSVGNTILNNLKSFKGEVYAVNPKYSEIEGVKCYPSILDVPDVDLAVIAVPARFVPKTIEECGRKGVSYAVIISAGFKETGSEGAALERKIVEIANKFGVRIVGPNCLGIMNPEINLNATFSSVMPEYGKVAFLSQSGAFILSVSVWAKKTRFGFSKVVSLGNKAMLDESDFIEYLANDNSTEAIMLYIEGIQNGKRFMEIAKKVAKKKPIIVMKSGKTESGSKAASSHTGSLAGSYEVYKAAFEQSCIVTAENVEELFDFSFALSKYRKVGDVAIITNSGGPGVMASDAVEIYGLKLAELSLDTVKKLKEVLPAAANFYNPVDILGDADTTRFLKAFDIVEKDENVGTILAILVPTASINFGEILKRVIKSTKPLFCCFTGLSGEEEEILIKNRIPNFFDPVRAVKTISAVKKYASFEFEEEIEDIEFEVDRRNAEEFISKKTGYVGVEGLELLKYYGINVAPFGIAKNADEAEEIAEKIGYPVAMKVVSPDIIHKTDFGAIKLDVTRENVRDTFFELVSRIEKFLPHARIEGVLVQKMVKGGREVILGAKKDPQFGNIVMFGLGGIYVEVFKDVSFRIAPVSKREAYKMIKSIKAYNILKGVRGEKMADLDSLAETIVRFSRLSIDYPILEMEINPLKVFEKGCVAIDFRMVLEGDIK
ncbi:MAG: acetate--CoA ligase family protein [Archaeoglobaceae archaeon]